ncbi:MAG: TIGR00282 family metallophosphoesterase [Pleomorphochaeta sp.]
MSIRVLFLGEIVGRPGTTVIKKLLKKEVQSRNIDLVIANGEGVTNGFGIGKNHSIMIHKAGVDVITGGEKIYYKIDMVDFLDKNNFIIRPINYPVNNPGKGIKYITINEKKIAIINVLGNSDFPRTHLSNAFLVVNSLVDKLKKDQDIVLVQFHASTTAEKNTMGYLLNGRATAVIGTHCKAITSDCRVLDKGTAYITDNGMVGSTNSVGGFESSVEIKKFLNAIPTRSKESWDRLQMQGVIVDIDEESNMASDIETIILDLELEEEK